MIIAVDDEELYRTLIDQALTAAGFAVQTFPDARSALEQMHTAEPELIISDVRMPEMDGFAFKEALSEQRPDLDVPFVFLSSMADPDQIVAGLDANADDYLTKPIDPRVLVAKVRTILARARTPRPVIFRGDLARFPFVQLLQHCERHALTGEIELEGAGFHAVIPVRGGQIAFDALGDSEQVLEKIYDLKEGSFIIRQHPVDFSALEPSRTASAAPGATGTQPQPAGLAKTAGTLSALHIEGRTFQVQTEIVSIPEPALETTVTTGGKIILKRHTPLGEGAAQDRLEHQVAAQHAEVEEEVRQRLRKLAAEKAKQPQPDTMKKFYDLFEEGLAAYQRKDFSEAVTVWERALKIKPGDATLEINLNIARSKLEQP